MKRAKQHHVYACPTEHEVRAPKYFRVKHETLVVVC